MTEQNRDAQLRLLAEGLAELASTLRAQPEGIGAEHWAAVFTAYSERCTQLVNVGWTQDDLNDLSVDLQRVWDPKSPECWNYYPVQQDPITRALSRLSDDKVAALEAAARPFPALFLMLRVVGELSDEHSSAAMRFRLQSWAEVETRLSARLAPGGEEPRPTA